MKTCWETKCTDNIWEIKESIKCFIKSIKENNWDLISCFWLMVDPDYSWYQTKQTHLWWKFCRKERCHSQFGSVIEPDPEASEHSRLSKHSCSTDCRLKPQNHTRFERCEREKQPRETFRFTNLIYYNSRTSATHWCVSAQSSEM